MAYMGDELCHGPYCRYVVLVSSHIPYGKLANRGTKGTGFSATKQRSLRDWWWSMSDRELRYQGRRPVPVQNLVLARAVELFGIRAD